MELLRLCTYLNNESIPYGLLKLFFQEDDAVSLELKVDEARRVAVEYSMLKLNEEQQTVSMHPLVQKIIQDGFLENEKNKYVAQIVSLLNICFQVTKERLDEEVLVNRLLYGHIRHVVAVCHP